MLERVFLLVGLLLPGVARAGGPRATLLVSEDASGKAPSKAGLLQRIPIQWRADDTAEATSLDGAVTLTLTQQEPAGAAARVLAIEVVWHKRAWVNLIGVELGFDGDHVQVIGRDLEPATVRLAYLERFDPKWIAISRKGKSVVNITVDDTVDDLLVKAGPQGIDVRIDLDAADARPFLHDARCTTNWHAPNQHLSMPARLRVPGEKVAARVQLVGEAVPLVKARYPDGRRAALVVTDHADQSSLRTLAALTKGLLAHHLEITKALFAHGSDRPQLEDPKVSALADELAEAGSEIVPHSATPKPDSRPVTQAALERFERWKTRTWIDHQPETNCEAFGDQGFHVGGKFGIADLLEAHRYQYVWAEDDAPPNEFNLLRPRRLDQRAPTVWPIGRLDLGGPDGLWMFRTVWAFLEARRFYALYSAPALDRLERERGLHVAHTYLETYHPKHTRFGTKNLLVPEDPKGEPGGAGPVKLDPRFDALLAELEARQARGSLWVPTLAVLADRLRATAEVTLTLDADGSVRLHAPKPVAGATFVVAQAGVHVLVGGHAPKGLRADGNNTTFWDDLPAGDTAVTLTTSDGTPLPFAAPPTEARAALHP